MTLLLKFFKRENDALLVERMNLFVFAFYFLAKHDLQKFSSEICSRSVQVPTHLVVISNAVSHCKTRVGKPFPVYDRMQSQMGLWNLPV